MSDQMTADCSTCNGTGMVPGMVMMFGGRHGAGYGRVRCRECVKRAENAGRWAPPQGKRIPGVPPWQAGRRLS